MTVRFNIRVQVLSYFPQTSGRELHIRLKPLEGQAPLSRESLRTPEGIRSLRSIEYEGDNAQGPILSLYFNRDVQFEATAGERPHDILITVSEPGVGCDTQQLSSTPKTGETPAPTPSTNQPAVPIPSGLYVVNVLAQPEVSGGQRVQFYAGDDANAKQAVRQVLEAIGYFPVDLGSLAAGGQLSQLPFGSLSATNFIKI